MHHEFFRNFSTHKQNLGLVFLEKKILGEPRADNRIKVWVCVRDNLFQSAVSANLLYRIYGMLVKASLTREQGYLVFGF